MSTSNKSVRFIHGLGKRKFREENGCFFLEGARAVSELVSAGATLQTLVVSKGYGEHLKPGSTQAEEIDRLIARAGDVLLVGDPVFRFLADTVTPQGIGAVLAFPVMPTLSDILPKATRLLILENLQDPGNLGTCIRTADAFGFDAVLCVSDCVDAYNPKVIRSTVGSMFHISVLRIETPISEFLTQVREAGFTVYGAHPRGGAKAGDDTLFSGKSAVIIGNEGAGLTEAAKRGSDCLVTIPMPGRAESLNAGIAASVLMYEVIRRKEDER